jgi:hypothetical protein
MSNAEEANLKINILNLDKSGFLYLSICKDETGFREQLKMNLSKSHVLPRQKK